MKNKHAEQLIDEELKEQPHFFKKQGLADFLDCHVNSVSRLIDSGELFAVQRRRQKGSVVLIPKSAVKEYLLRSAR